MHSAASPPLASCLSPRGRPSTTHRRSIFGSQAVTRRASLLAARLSNSERHGTHFMPPDVLSDHCRRNKTLVTPFDQVNPPRQEVSWKDEITPQVLWIALLHEFNGYPKGQDIALLLSRAARLLTGRNTTRAYYAASEYECISTKGWASIRRNLHAYGCLERVTNALGPLESFSKNTPFLGILRDVPSIPSDSAEKIIRSLVRRLSLRQDSWESTMVQYTVARIAFSSNRVEILADADIELPSPDAVDEYPRTAKSIGVAASLRDLVTELFDPAVVNPHISPESWARRFWRDCLTPVPSED